MRFASRSSTRRTPEDFCSDRNRGKPTWFAGDWESRGDTGGPSMTYPTADVMAGVGCPRLDRPRPGASVRRCCATSLSRFFPAGSLRDWIAKEMRFLSYMF